MGIFGMLFGGVQRWRGWLKPGNHCLVPANRFAEYAPDRNPETKMKDVVWFALDDSRPLFYLRRHLGPSSKEIAVRNRSRSLARTSSTGS